MRRRRGRLDGAEGLENSIAVARTTRDDPRIAGSKSDHLAFDVELSAAAEDVADDLVIARALFGRSRARLFVPKSHSDADAGREVNLSVRAFGGMPRIDLDDGGIHPC